LSEFRVICPDETGSGITIWDVMGKIRWESLMWGFGTALGELPPYFMARAARISGMSSEDEEMEEFAELLQRKKTGVETSTLVTPTILLLAFLDRFMESFYVL